MNMQGVHWFGSCYEGSGYSNVLRSYLYWMIKQGRDVNFSNINYSLENNLKYIDQSVIDFYKQYEQQQILNTGSSKVFINHSTPDILFVNPKFKNNFAYSVWESTFIPLKAKNKCNNFDALFTASEYSKNAFENSGVKIPIEIIPHIVVPRDLKEDKFLEELTKDKLVFLAIFDWHIGKGYDVLLKGFIEAFKDDKDVLLILKTNSFVNFKTLQSTVVNYIKMVKQNNEFPKILPIAYPLKEDKFYSLYKYCDVYLSMSRREAFSLTCADAIVNGKLVVAPSLGGQRYFLNENNSCLVESKMDDIKKVERERSNYRGQWVEPSLDDFIFKLKIIKEKWSCRTQEDKDELKKESEKVIQLLSPENVLEMFDKVFDRFN
jgi:glycosyltransferase involved in cell wall biosynthesis